MTTVDPKGRLTLLEWAVVSQSHHFDVIKRQFQDDLEKAQGRLSAQERQIAIAAAREAGLKKELEVARKEIARQQALVSVSHASAKAAAESPKESLVSQSKSFPSTSGFVKEASALAQQAGAVRMARDSMAAQQLKKEGRAQGQPHKREVNAFDAAGKLMCETDAPSLWAAAAKLSRASQPIASLSSSQGRSVPMASVGGVLPKDLTLTMSDAVSTEGKKKSQAPSSQPDSSMSSSTSSTLSSSTTPGSFALKKSQPHRRIDADENLSADVAVPRQDDGNSGEQGHVQQQLPRTWTWTEHFDKNTKRMYVRIDLR